MISAEIVTSSERKFQRTLQSLADATDRPVGDVLRQQGRLLAGDMAYHTRPTGKSASVGADLKRRIAKTVWKYYTSVGEVHQQLLTRHGQGAAKNVVRLIRTGRYPEAQRLLNSSLRIHSFGTQVGPFDGGELHRQHRFKNRSHHPIRVVPNTAEVRRYIRREQAQAGFAKAAFVRAGQQLDGQARFAAWLKKPESPGRGILRRLKNGWHGRLENSVRYLRDALPLSRELRAISVRQQTAEKQLKRITDNNLRKAMRRQR